MHLLPTRNVEANHVRSVIDLHCEPRKTHGKSQLSFAHRYHIFVLEQRNIFPAANKENQRKKLEVACIFQDRVFRDIVAEHRGQAITVVEVGAHLGGSQL